MGTELAGGFGRHRRLAPSRSPNATPRFRMDGALTFAATPVDPVGCGEPCVTVAGPVEFAEVKNVDARFRSLARVPGR